MSDADNSFIPQAFPDSQTSQPALGNSGGIFSGLTSPGAGYVNAAAGLLNAGTNVASTAANISGNSAHAQQSNTTSVPVGAPDSYPQALQTTEALSPQTDATNAALQKAAEQEKAIGGPVTQQAVDTAQDATENSYEQQAAAQKAYLDALQNSHNLTIAAGAALDDASQNAAIDPQRYLNNLGVSGKTVSAIGMALSGIGSGLTGQPNLAVELFNKNVERDIAAQKQIFQNKMAVSAAAQGLLKTSQQAEQISSTAQNMATMSVSAGISSTLQSLQAQVKVLTSPETIQQLNLQNNLNNQKAQQSFTTNYTRQSQSGDIKTMNLNAILTTAAMEHLIPGSTSRFSLSPQNASQRAGLQQGGGYSLGVGSGTPPPSSSQGQLGLNEATGKVHFDTSGSSDHGVPNSELQLDKNGRVIPQSTPTQGSSDNFLDKFMAAHGGGTPQEAPPSNNKKYRLLGTAPEGEPIDLAGSVGKTGNFLKSLYDKLDDEANSVGVKK